MVPILLFAKSMVIDWWVWKINKPNTKKQIWKFLKKQNKKNKNKIKTATKQTVKPFYIHWVGKKVYCT